MSGDCCEKLKEQLAALNAEVGRVRQEFQKANQKIGELDRRLKNLEGKNTPNKQGGEKSNNESEILRRLAKLEKLVSAIEQFVLSLNPILQVLKKFNLFDILLK